jgi:hypothetical protein
MRKANDADIYLIELIKAIYEKDLAAGHEVADIKQLISLLDSAIKTMKEGE